MSAIHQKLWNIEAGTLGGRRIPEAKVAELLRTADGSREASQYLEDFLHRKSAYLDGKDRANLMRVLGFVDEVPATQVARVIQGPRPDSFEDDEVHFGADGKMAGTSGVTPYVRSYNARSQGPLRQRHGSPRCIVASATTVAPARFLVRHVPCLVQPQFLS